MERKNRGQTELKEKKEDMKQTKRKLNMNIRYH
jgi:hypothetical protein